MHDTARIGTSWSLFDGLGPTEAERVSQARDAADEVASRFHELRDSVYRYVAYGLRNPSEAEEITQEAFLKLYKALRGGHRIGSVSAWVFSVARNLSIDRTRRRERQYLQAVSQSVWRLLEERVPNGEPSSEERLVHSARRREIQDALSILTPIQRQCFQLRVEGLRYREIADALGMSVCGVADAVQRAVKRLRESIGD